MIIETILMLEHFLDCFKINYYFHNYKSNFENDLVIIITNL